MNKKLLALLAVAAVGVSVAGATPQTQFNKGEFQVDLGANHMKDKADNISGQKAKWDFDGGLTYALTDKTAIQYGYHGMKHKDDADSYKASMQEVNLVQSLNKNFAVYGGYGRIKHDDWKTNNIAQAGVIGKANLGSKVEVYGKAGVGTKRTTTWEAGLGYKVTEDLDINAGYRYINTREDDKHNVSFQGPTVGLSYRFGGTKKAEPVVVPQPVAPVVTPAPVVERPVQPAPYVAKDYYVQSIYFDSDQSVPRADQAPNLQAALNAANQYPNDAVKLMGNADTDANPEYNIGLSERRIQDVAQFLVNNGVSADRLIGIANGDAKPVASNASSTGKAENRRVDVYIHR